MLPMSMGPRDGDERHHQHEEAENWGRYLRQFELEFIPFYWTERLREQDAAILWRLLEDSAVVVLAGGGSSTGLRRYQELGRRFAGDPGRFGQLLRGRQESGLLTVGFSAGADQLMERLFKSTLGAQEDTRAFGLVRGVLATLHHDPSRNGELQNAATVAPWARVFALPNDSGLLVAHGRTSRGGDWQLLRFIVDHSWDRPEDQWHVQTRRGANVDHLYPDGRHWTFRDGDWMLRAWRPEGPDQTWMGVGGRTLDWASQTQVDASSPEGLIAQL